MHFEIPSRMDSSLAFVRSTVLIAAVVAMTGCFGDPLPEEPDAGEKLVDVPLAVDTRGGADVALDTTVADTVTPDDIVSGDTAADISPPTDISARDSSVSDAAPRCRADADCPDPALRRCDLASGRCVGCLPAMDECPRGQRCDPGSSACVSGCRRDDDCRPEGDAGTARPPTCDMTRSICIECATDDDCPVRTLCTMGRCLPGCNERRGCGQGEVCCGNICVDGQSDTSHCGACGRRCETANGVPACTAGNCSVAMCTEGFTDCNAQVDDGCEVEVRNDPRHCGRCGNVCPTVPNAGVIACASGRCGFTCSEGFADCDGSSANGCERNLNSDVANCGRCANPCPNRTGASGPVCAMGACRFMCSPGRADCDGDAETGCEVDTRASVTHCGACERACPTPAHATPTCTAGNCGFTCEPGFGDCDGDPANGCEAELAATVEHCGRCGNRCNLAGGTAACVGGQCVIAACGGDFADCDALAANGCETDVRTSILHCGSCGGRCPTASNAAASCSIRQCSLTCNAGFANCDGAGGNGCEIDLRSDVLNCGACGRGCSLPNAVVGCSASACSVAGCASGFGNCDGSPANGCETSLTSTLAHCGACNQRGVEVCDGRDNSCDTRIDDGCPTGLANLDALDFTSGTYGSGSGTTFNLACPAGQFVRGAFGRFVSSSTYPTVLSLLCATPRLVEDRATTPYRYTVVWTQTSMVGPVGSGSGLTWRYECPANTVVHRVGGRFSGSVVTQLQFECAAWNLTGTPGAFRIARGASTTSPLLGTALGTAFSYLCPANASGVPSTLRNVFGRASTYLAAVAFRCTAPGVTMR